MKLREYENRFPDGTILGAIMYMPNHMAHPMALRYFSKSLAWFVDKATYPGGAILLIEIGSYDLLNTKVSGWVNNKRPLMEGDWIWLKDPVSRVNRKEKVIRIKEGNRSPYPIVTATEYGEKQYKWSEVLMVSNEDNHAI